MPIPVSVWSGTFKIMGVEIRCHVLDNGQRIIEEESLQDFISALADGNMSPIDIAELHQFVLWHKGAMKP
jgi:hypothetical protein